MAGTFAASRPDGSLEDELSEEPTTIGVEAAVKAVMEATDLQTDSLIVRSLQDAAKFHDGQNRSWKQVPHMQHVLRVTSRVMLFHDVTTPEITGTAWHDVGEMCCRDVQAQDSVYRLHEDRYGRESMEVMRGLTNVSVFYKMPRQERKKHDFNHIARQPWKIKRIKAIDRIDNLTETVLDLMSGIGASPRFALLYADESDALAVALSGIDTELLAELKEATREVRRVASTIMDSQS
jgi:hypothetical protein